ncbi:hypothetical protein Baya_15736 [Bagarius yarrelli]|uniref:Uncharacterized protein n=1 Tax=Bagarius yarrelli TaxID=175774 RepID=A0A556VCG8_BAGYA|nr:hypothetical protein Baya_15736 [Bagarius yarrelli]
MIGTNEFHMWREPGRGLEQINTRRRGATERSGYCGMNARQKQKVNPGCETERRQTCGFGKRCNSFASLSVGSSQLAACLLARLRDFQHHDVSALEFFRPVQNASHVSSFFSRLVLTSRMFQACFLTASQFPLCSEFSLDLTLYRVPESPAVYEESEP